jgi:hypothetical protein
MLINTTDPTPPLPPKPPRGWYYGKTQNWPTINRELKHGARAGSGMFNGPGFGQFPLPPQLRRLYVAFCAQFWLTLSGAQMATWAALGGAHSWPLYDQAPATLTAFEMFMFYNLTIFYHQQRPILLGGVLPFQPLNKPAPTPAAPALAMTLNSFSVNTNGTYTINVTGPVVPNSFFLINVYYSNPARKTASRANLDCVDTGFIFGQGPGNITSLALGPQLISAIKPNNNMRVGVRAVSYQILGDGTGTNYITGPIVSRRLRDQ